MSAAGKPKQGGTPGTVPAPPLSAWARKRVIKEPRKVSLDGLLSWCLITLWRDIYLLKASSAPGHGELEPRKLSSTDAERLRDNIKLLMDLKKREKDLLDGLTDEELDELAKIKKQETNDFSGSSRKGEDTTRKAKKRG